MAPRHVLAASAIAVILACGSGGGTKTEPTPTLPAAPQGVTATAADAAVTVTWAAVSGAASYNLYWSTRSGVTPASGTKVAGASSPYVHSGLTNGAPTYYVVTAVSPAGEGPASSQASATPTAAGVIDLSSGCSIGTRSGSPPTRCSGTRRSSPTRTRAWPAWR